MIDQQVAAEKRADLIKRYFDNELINEDQPEDWEDVRFMIRTYTLASKGSDARIAFIIALMDPIIKTGIKPAIGHCVRVS